MYYLKNDIEIKLRCVFISFWSLFLSFINYPFTLFLQVFATDFQSHPLAKPTHREALSSTLPEPAQQMKSRWKIPGVPIWTFKWSFSVTQICEICIFSFLCRAIELRQMQRILVRMLLKNALENDSRQRMNLGRPWEGLGRTEMLFIIIPSTVWHSVFEYFTHSHYFVFSFPLGYRSSSKTTWFCIHFTDSKGSILGSEEQNGDSSRDKPLTSKKVLIVSKIC